MKIHYACRKATKASNAQMNQSHCNDVIQKFYSVQGLSLSYSFLCLNTYSMDGLLVPSAKHAICHFAITAILLCISQINSIQFRSNTLDDAVILECNDSMPGNWSQWQHNDQVIFVNMLAINERFERPISLLRNYSLHIRNVLLHHEGIYKCLHESAVVIKYCLQVTGMDFILSKHIQSWSVKKFKNIAHAFLSQEYISKRILFLV